MAKRIKSILLVCILLLQLMALGNMAYATSTFDQTVKNAINGMNSSAYETYVNGTKVKSLSSFDSEIKVVFLGIKCTQTDITSYKAAVDSSSSFTPLSGNEFSFQPATGTDMYKLEITGLKANGTGNEMKLTFTKSGVTESIARTFTIGEAPAKVVQDTSKVEHTTEAEPNLIIKASSIGRQNVKAGETFTLSLDVYATTSGYSTAKDVVVSVTSDEGTTVASGSSSYYVGDMYAGSTKNVTFPMKAINSFTGGVSKITVTVGGTGNSSTTTISVPVVQPDRFEVTKVEVPEILMVGEEGTLSVVYINKGKNPAYNVTGKLECDGFTEAYQEDYVGNVAAGTQESLDFDISALVAGTTSGKVTILYENPDGDEVTIEKEFSIVVEEGFSDMDMGFDETPYEEMPAEQHTPVWVFLLIGAAVIGACVGGYFLLKKNKEKKLLEETWEDDEDI